MRFHAAAAAGPGDSAVITMPFDPDEAWGAKADHPVGGTIGGCRIRASLVPEGSGWVLTLAANRLRGMGLAAGDDMIIELAPEARNAAILPATSPQRSRPPRPRAPSSTRWLSSTARRTSAGSMRPLAGRISVRPASVRWQTYSRRGSKHCVCLDPEGNVVQTTQSLVAWRRTAGVGA